ncbi:hypothetical protein OXX79_010716 [Metschnikowia pulcherrima]
MSTSEMKNVDPKVVAAQNRRKIEKDKRRKNYHDSQVQGTNNSSIVSKRSVEMIYNPVTEPKARDWFKYFVPKGKRRSPAINRGYWVRMESIKQAVRRIQNQYRDTVRVVNLGCGFDPFPFKTLAESENAFEFFDFDYPELVAKKLSMIKKAPEIMEVIGKENAIEETEQKLGVVMSTDPYKLVGCDLKDTELYEKQLECLLHSGVPTIFIAEVSLAYMKPEHANPVVEISSRLPNSHVLVLEQIMPSGDSHFFAQKMLYHFSHLRSPLQCVETYSTKEKQQARFSKYFPRVEIIDLFESWGQLVSSEMKELVASVEDFDEWEEFIVFCQHYVVIHATNSSSNIFTQETAPPDLDIVQPFSISPMIVDVRLKFPACANTSSGTFIHGGMSQTRSDDLFILGQEKSLIPSKATKKPSARMCHTLSSLGNGSLLLVGGRARPGVALSDVWVYNEGTDNWEMIGEVGEGMSRHSAVTVGDGRVLVFGNGKFKLIVCKDNKYSFHDVLAHGSIPSLQSCAMTFDHETKTGYIVGGMLEATGPTINDILYSFFLHDTEMSVTNVKKSAHFARVGCLAKVKDDELYILGGAGHALQDQCSTVLAYDLKTDVLSGRRIPDDVWETHPVFIGSQLTGDLVIGGGAVCYSFGSCFNKGYSIS